MDEHARRMLNRFVVAVENFRAGTFSLMDVSRCAGQTAATIDNASAPFPSLLKSAEGDLEFAYFATELEEHGAELERIVLPIVAALNAQPEAL